MVGVTGSRVAGARRVLGAVAAVLCTTLAAAAPRDVALEHEVKAVFLHKITRFVEWPAGAGDRSLRIGILGEDPFREALDAAFRDTAAGRPAEIVRASSLDRLGKVDVLFISASKREELCAVLHTLRGEPTLTVSDLEGFCEKGGMVALAMEDRRVRIRANVEATERATLRIQASLLRLAIVVSGDDCD